MTITIQELNQIINQYQITVIINGEYYDLKVGDNINDDLNKFTSIAS